MRKVARPAKPTGKRKTVAAPETEASFPIVGIGASAGGLETLDSFFKQVPPASGMAFVVVQHLAPSGKGAMPELLQRSTPMQVLQVEDRTTVRPNRVYVIPPNKDLSILHGVLHLLDPVEPRGRRLPIDFFFRTLADDLEERSIGVILSGMGTDGTQGLRAIKARAGLTFVQDPASAKFDGMPRSAMEAGLADVVAPAEELPGKIIARLREGPLAAEPRLANDDRSRGVLEKILILLRAQTGHDFSLYKKNSVYRRIERRMGIHQIDRIASYLRLLQESPQEVELLFKELLIGVTRFFRDPPAWEQLKTQIVPALIEKRPAGQAVRVWVPACSTGEEAYSLAIAFHEACDRLEPARKPALQIFATDLDRDAIERARAAVYPPDITADVSPERLRRYFVPTENGYQVGKTIREAVVFAPHNVIMDPPFTKLDLISCRNLLIYMTPPLQQKLMALFHYALNPGGILLLGSAETTGSATDFFTALSGKARFYRRLDSAPRSRLHDFPSAFATPLAGVAAAKAPTATQTLQSAAEQVLLQHYSPAAVLVDDKGNILHINGKTGAYLEPVAGKANWNVFAMARNGLRYELTDAFRKAIRLRKTVTRKNVEIRSGRTVRTVNLSVQPLSEAAALGTPVLIVLTEVTPARPAPKPGRPQGSGRGRSAELERDVQLARQELQIAHEDMQTSQEETRAANEELLSANEELQSTNEELTTSKEEMQSMNEELQTLNQELQSKVDELSRLNNDMKNLLNNTDIATVFLFLDTELRVRLFTAGSNRLFRLIPSDVGRPITDIASDLDYPGLADDAREVLRTLTVHERPAAGRNGQWFNVRIMPYRTVDDSVDGVVITFSDISVSKKLEATLRETQARLEQRIADQDVKLQHEGVHQRHGHIEQ